MLNDFFCRRVYPESQYPDSVDCPVRLPVSALLSGFRFEEAGNLFRESAHLLHGYLFDDVFEIEPSNFLATLVTVIS